MPRTRSSGIKLAAAVSAALALAFVVFGGLANGYTLNNIAWLAVSGAIFGAIGAPSIEPEAFRYPTLWQMFFSVLGCVLIAAYLQAGVGGFALAVAVGLVLGYLAPYWVNHIQVP
jgi:hypothetical protein